MWRKKKRGWDSTGIMRVRAAGEVEVDELRAEEFIKYVTWNFCCD